MESRACRAHPSEKQRTYEASRVLLHVHLDLPHWCTCVEVHVDAAHTRILRPRRLLLLVLLLLRWAWLDRPQDGHHEEMVALGIMEEDVRHWRRGGRGYGALPQAAEERPLASDLWVRAGHSPRALCPGVGIESTDAHVGAPLPSEGTLNVRFREKSRSGAHACVRAFWDTRVEKQCEKQRASALLLKRSCTHQGLFFATANLYASEHC